MIHTFINILCMGNVAVLLDDFSCMLNTCLQLSDIPRILDIVLQQKQRSALMPLREQQPPNYAPGQHQSMPMFPQQPI